MIASMSMGVARLAFFILFALVAFNECAAAQESSESLTFGLISPREIDETRSNWQPLVDRLSTALGRKVNIRVYEAQGLIVQDFIDGKVDIAWMGNAPALSVVEAGAGSVFAQMVSLSGSFGYKSILMVHKTSRIQSLPEVFLKARDLTLGMGDVKSTSGYLVPSYYAFQKSGVENIHQTFKKVETGSHLDNLNRVATKQVDVGVTNTEELEFYTRNQPALAAQIRVIWESPTIPQSPLLLKDKLPLTLRKQIKLFIVGFGKSADEKAILKQLNGLSRFRPSSNKQLVPIADLEMFKLRQAINSDRDLTQASREARIKETIERGSKLELKLKLGAEAF